MNQKNEKAEALEPIPPQPGPYQPIPFPYRDLLVSGLYKWTQPILIQPQPIPIPFPRQPVPLPIPEPLPGPIPLPIPGPDPLPSPIVEFEGTALTPIFRREELRLDVDGQYPRMVVSGTIFTYMAVTMHWIANLAWAGVNTWAGSIWYKDGNEASFPYTNVSVKVNHTWFPANRQATVTFSGGGAPNRVCTYKYASLYFHEVEFEFDTAAGTTAITSINTGAHPNRPAILSTENLSIETVYRRAGFDVRKSGDDNVVPLAGAAADARWSDMEMHDAMQTYWSCFANIAQWSIWVFFASLHERGTNLGGIMFDDIGPNHRQGTSVFEDSFIANAPAGETHPAAWISRMRFWTAVHEMGHTFNLAHSWQKEHPPSWGSSWIPLSNEPEARSFMNYPYYVSGGETAFFSDFEFRFSDAELLFLRHAPARFVQQGNANWFDDHGFQQANVSCEPKFRLEVRANRSKAEFEFLEPVQLELKLSNISSQPLVVPEDILSSSQNLTVILKKKGKPAREYKSYAQYCMKTGMQVLMPGGSVYAPLSPYAGLNGMDMIEPGYYSVQASLHLPSEEDAVSNLLSVRITPPCSYDEEYLAQDFYNDEVGRILGLGGSKFLANGINTLKEVAARLTDRRVALHARVALTNPMMRKYKTLEIPEGRYSMQPSAMIKGAKIKTSAIDEKSVMKEMSDILVNKASASAESLGHINYRQGTEFYAEFLAEHGDYSMAASVQDSLYNSLFEQKVLPSVLKEIKAKGAQFERRVKTKG